MRLEGRLFLPSLVNGMPSERDAVDLIEWLLPGWHVTGVEGIAQFLIDASSFGEGRKETRIPAGEFEIRFIAHRPSPGAG